VAQPLNHYKHTSTRLLYIAAGMPMSYTSLTAAWLGAAAAGGLAGSPQA